MFHRYLVDAALAARQTLPVLISVQRVEQT
jgi:hypothetical protein